MATLPSFPPFEPATETWDDYLTRFECVLRAADLTGLSSSRKLGYFLSSCGRDIFATARALTAPQEVYLVSWDTLIEKLRNHYSPAPSKVARRHAFRQRFQKEGESINDYIAALRTAAVNCEFTDLEDLLLDQLICGVQDLRLQRRLLAKKDLTLTAALDEARASELSEKSVSEMQKARPLHSQTKPQSIHHEDSDPDILSDEELDICRLQTTRRKPSNTNHPPQQPCFSCGGSHNRNDCRFRNATCRHCGKQGHLARVCMSSQPTPTNTPTGAYQQKRPPAPVSRQPPGFRPRPPRRPPTFQDSYQSTSRDFSSVSYQINNASLLGPSQKLFVTIQLEGQPCKMEVDTGSSKSLLSWDTLLQLIPNFDRKKLQPCPITLRDYQGNRIPLVGCGSFFVSYADFRDYLPLIIVNGHLPALLGMNWFHALGLTVSGIHTTTTSPAISITPEGHLAALQNEFPDVFAPGLGKYTGTPISFNLDPQVAPIRLKPRRVPLALRAKVDLELDKLISQGVLQPVDHAKWETPIVIPLKPDGSIRICADYKATLNRALQSNPYPVPVVQHLLHSLGRGSVFAKLDLAQAYQQLPVDEQTALAQTVVTHRGAFKCTRLQFGVSTAPGIFQSLMERLLHGLQGVVPYFDDVLISASNPTELFARVRDVLLKFRKAGLRLRPDKCQFGVSQVEFLGFLIDAQGIRPTPSKIEAIQLAPTPSSKTELQAFLGLLNFYSVFLPHKATFAEPLHRLLDSRTAWHWGPAQETAFRTIKQLLTSEAVLVQYSDSLPLLLACDASPYGVGAVLSHILPNGSEAPLAFYSRTMSQAERNYSQLDREALACVAGVRKFHDYLYGRHFHLLTDHKPLLGILANNRQSPNVLSLRMSRWLEFMASYSYTLHYRPGRQMGHADALSRCPLPKPVQDPAPAASILLVEESSLPVTASHIAAKSAKDPVLLQVLDWVRRGWPSVSPSPMFQPFFNRRHELTVMKGCLLWGHRVVVPPSLRTNVLQCLHKAHPGIVRMKALARSYAWWPQIDNQIEEWVNGCKPCQMSRPSPPAAPVCEWESARAPWSRLHLDLAGPFHGHTFLVLVDSYSKWVELAQTPSTTSEYIIPILDSIFATHGFPDVLVTDNGPQFTSSVFEAYLSRMGVRHAKTAPAHPAANGLAERAVRSAKEALSRLGTSNWQANLTTYLMAQHTTPCQATGLSPAELLMGRRLRTILDRLHPGYVELQQPCRQTTPRLLQPGDPVFALNLGIGPKWVPGHISQITGPCSYRVLLEDGRTWRRHINQLRRRFPDNDQPPDMSTPPSLRSTSLLTTPPPETAPTRLAVPALVFPPRMTVATDPTEGGDHIPRVPPPLTPGPVLRRSGRIRRSPAYLEDYACTIQEGRGVKS